MIASKDMTASKRSTTRKPKTNATQTTKTLNRKASRSTADLGPRIYTKMGDQGETSLLGGTRLKKSDVRLEAYGTLDELNSALGVLISSLKPRQHADVIEALTSVQSDLFLIGSRLAADTPEMRARLAEIGPAQVDALEAQIDKWTAGLKPLRNFILPGGHPTAALAHLARTICRRAERLAVETPEVEPIVLKYINRLSDHLFVLARELNRRARLPDQIWVSR